MYPRELGPIPEETVRVARAACPKGTLAMRLRDSLGELYQDEHFASLYPVEGQPAYEPWRLAIVTVLQYAEGLTDRQAANAVRERIDWKYALGLELGDPGFDFSVLCEFRARLIERQQETLLLDRLLPLRARLPPSPAATLLSPRQFRAGATSPMPQQLARQLSPVPFPCSW